MSVAPASHNQSQARPPTEVKAPEHPLITPTENTGGSFGGGRVTFDKSGNRLVDNKIANFASKSAYNQFLSERGVDPQSKQIVDQAKYEKADWSTIPGFDSSQKKTDFAGNPIGTEYLTPSARTKTIRVEGSMKSSPLTGLTKPQGRAIEESKLDIIGGVKTSESAGKSFGWDVMSGRLGQKEFSRDSQAEAKAKTSEASKASSLFTPQANKDYDTGGKKSENMIVSLGKAEKVFGKENSYGWDNVGKTNFTRDSKTELQTKESEAARASLLFPKESKSLPITNTVFGGVETKQSKGKSFGWEDISKTQFTREGKTAGLEEKVKASETSKASLVYPNKANLEYNPLQNVTDKSVAKNSRDVFGVAKTNEVVTSPVSKTIPSEKQQTITSEKEFKSFLNQGQKQDAVFVFYKGDKQVGQTSGPRAFGDFLRTQKQFGDISVQATYPTKEKAISTSVQKNTEFFSGMPQSYWDRLGKEGYVSKNNVADINKSLFLNSAVKSRENLGLLQGTLFAESRGGIIPTEKGTAVVGPAEHEVASFMKFPFAGRKISTSTVESTSYFNVLQFLPGLGEKELELASRGVGSLAGKLAPKVTTFKGGVESKVKTAVANRVLYESPFLGPKEESKPLSLEKVSVRQRATYRPTNMMREPLSSDILSRDTALGRTPGSATPQIPRNTMFEDVTKETQTGLTKTQSDLLAPKTPEPSTPASTNIPFFPGRTDQTGKAFTGNLPPVRTSEAAPPTSELPSNVFGKTFSEAPVKTPSRPKEEEFSGVSPISRKFFGKQFKGSYPESYLPPASGFATSAKAERPIVNLEPQKEYQDFRFQQYEEKQAKKASQGPLNFGFTVKEKTSSKSVSPDFTYRNKVPMERLGATKKSSKNIAKVDVNTLLGLEKGPPAIGESKERLSIIEKAAATRNAREAQKNVFTTTNVNLGRGPGGQVGKGYGDLFKGKPKPPSTPPKSMFKPEETKPSKSGLVQIMRPVTEKPVKSQFKEYPVSLGKTEKVKQITRKKPKTESATQQFQVTNVKLGQSHGLVTSVGKTKVEQKTKLYSATKQRQETQSKFAFETKQKSKTGTLFKGVLGFKQAQSYKPLQRQKQKPFSANMLRFATSPKSSTKPKQVSLSLLRTPQVTRQRQVQRQKQDNMFRSLGSQTKPKGPLPPPLLFGKLPGGKRYKSKEGPTGLYKLDVNNVFASGLSIKEKGSRFV